MNNGEGGEGRKIEWERGKNETVDGTENEWKTRPAFIQRRLFAKRRVELRQERRSQREAAGRGVPFLCSREGPSVFPRSRGRGGAAPRWLLRWPSSPLQLPPSQGRACWPRSPKRLPPVPHRDGLQGPDAGPAGPVRARVFGITAFVRKRPAGISPNAATRGARGPHEIRTHLSLKKQLAWSRRSPPHP